MTRKAKLRNLANICQGKRKNHYLRIVKTVYRVLRSVLVSAICLLVLVPGLLFVALSVSPVQRRIASVCEKELSSLLDCRVTVGGLGIVPFNRVVLRNVSVETTPGDTALTVRRLGAGVRLFSLISDDPITVNYVELNGLDLRLMRDSASAPLNIQCVIDALSPKDRNKPPSRFDLRINTVMLRSSSVSYDVMSEPAAEAFSPSHLKVMNLRADMRIPRLKNDDFCISIKRMGFSERSGFSLTNLTGEVDLSADSLATRNVNVILPNSSLSLADFMLPLKGLPSISDRLRHGGWRLALESGSYVTPSDLSAFMPQLERFDARLVFDRLSAWGNLDDLSSSIKLSYGTGLALSLSGRVADLSRDNRVAKVDELSLRGTGESVAEIVSAFTRLSHNDAAMMARLGGVTLDATAEMRGSRGFFDGALHTAVGSADLVADGVFVSPERFSADVTLATEDFIDIAALTGNPAIGGVEGDVEAKISRSGRRWAGSADMELDRLMLKGYTYLAAKAHAELDNGMLTASASIDNPDLEFALQGAYSLTPGLKHITLSGDVGRFVPSNLNLWGRFPGGDITGKIDVALEGETFGHMDGYATLSGWKLAIPGGGVLPLDNFTMTSSRDHIAVRSDYIDGELRGRYDFRHLPKAMEGVLAHVFPSLASEAGDVKNREDFNDFRYSFTLKPTESIAEFFKLPVSVVYPAQINGVVNEPEGDVAFNLSAPFLRNGSKLIEDTRMSAFVSGSENSASFDLSTVAPTKNGPLSLMVQSVGGGDEFDTDISWKISRDKAYQGNVAATTRFARNDDGVLLTDIGLQRSYLTFNDSTWTVNPASIRLAGLDRIDIRGIDVHRSDQFVKIEGGVSSSPLSLLMVDLRNFNLDYLFESLGIDKVMIGGDATGTFYASRLLSKEPMIETPGLSVKAISYNKTVIGDAVVKSRWDTETRGITLAAAISQEGGRSSFVDGAIYPLNDSLDITFTVDHANVGFMRPYMEAFASDISGRASGRARIFGTFKQIDLEGDVCAHDLRLKINFTNTYYTASDSVHFRPGLIDLDGIRIKDSEGHTARLNGWLRHEFFKHPTFEFSVTGARNFLSYNETARDNPLWYGKIYGDGSVFVKGRPGVVDISVDMATAPKSTFTFVLSDQEVADEYSFLTFRDKNRIEAELTDTLTLERDTSMDLVNRLRARNDAAESGESSDYNLSFQMRVTPEAQINLVMDPVGGDRIRAYGSGHLRMDYGSANNDLKMYGTYTLERGNYNFTLQDIIIKEFTIKPGSSIAFQGDPYSAQLNIHAAYALNANLSDLDESFLQDKDLNRTNVPVHAVLNVTGDMRQPEIAFDLEFPTLTTDIYRKVRSIISTDDMMNRQIIYLLALNRFYTPEYMASTTKGNELVSVASSTISSQLSNLLGQISDNWNIAPTFRSDRGDFSDVEVDVALSSRLLNNRLLFNGNFGYRDNSMNTSQFVGDFDLEYLLDRGGMWRLKAYNRYNDQNYYLRTAPTTQGVGVVLKRDFNSFFSFLRAFRKKKP